MSLLDIFNDNTFGLASLTDAIQKLPYVPARIGQLGLFETQGVPTNTIVVEERDGVLALLPTKRRGEPATAARSGHRKARSFAIPHIPYEDTVLAEQVSGVRAFGSENELDGVAQVVNDRLAQMRQDHEVTLEYHRVGALQGVILDADGSTPIYNLFTEFGVAEQTVDFVLATATTDVRAACISVARAMEGALGALPQTGIHAMCGATWFDALIAHDYVKDAYHRFQDSANLRNDPRKGFEFGGIMFEEYRGSIGGVSFVPATEARFVPLGVPGLFKTYFGPADFMETVNTIGLPIYAKQERMDFDRGIRLHTQSNPLCLCLRPRALVKGTMS